MIKYIVHTISSLRDVNGNCYHYAIVTSVKSGISIAISSYGSDNARYDILAANPKLKHENIFCVQSFEAKKEWKRMEKYAKPSYKKLTIKDLRNLDKGVIIQ